MYYTFLHRWHLSFLEVEMVACRWLPRTDCDEVGTLILNFGTARPYFGGGVGWIQDLGMKLES